MVGGARGLRSQGTAALVSVAAVLLVGCAPVADVGPGGARETVSTPRGQLVLEFDEGLGKRGTPLRRVQSSGTARTTVAIARAGGGDLRRAAGRYGFSVRTPVKPGQRAAVVVRPRGDDVLNPRRRVLRWGADVSLAPRTLRKKGGSNVLQRGLYADPVQYKLQVDNGLPSCRVRGARGAALVKAEEKLEPRTWYRLRCQLRDGELHLRVATAGRPEGRVFTTGAKVGLLDFDPAVPLAVGAKVNRAGRVVSRSPEQFHGRLDNVFVAVGR